jgi:predicted RNA-binding Zn-ribbon protein involved in translation (DUF1610 family)
MWRCHYCRLSLSVDTQLKHQACPGCGSDIHSCKNCTHYDESTSDKCREPNSPWVSDRNTANECPFFEFRATAENQPATASQDKANTEAEKAKEAFRALFRDL